MDEMRRQVSGEETFSWRMHRRPNQQLDVDVRTDVIDGQHEGRRGNASRGRRDGIKRKV